MGEGASLVQARAVLRESFGFEGFRPGQEQVVSAVLSGRDALAVMPTGAGKSLCYQVPALVLPGLAVVVSPLISLMHDQVASLVAAGVRGAYLDSTFRPEVRREVLRRARAGRYDLMYVSPERLATEEFRAFAAEAGVSLVAVDEAHCVSQWGHDFRPEYRDIAGFVEGLPRRPAVVALTATATRRVRDDIRSQLRLRDPEVVVTGFDRPNLALAVVRATPKERRAWVLAYARRHAQDAGIVYCTRRRDVDQLVGELADAGVSAAGYHAGMDADGRARAQAAFDHDDVRVMVATTAFGMGIDKSNVRFVINCGLPLSLEEYYQQAGRAGRDGERAECVLLWSDGDIRSCHWLLDHTEPDPTLTPDEQAALARYRSDNLGAMIGYAQAKGCLRAKILRYFGQEADVPEGGCGGCSACLGEEVLAGGDPLVAERRERAAARRSRGGGVPVPAGGVLGGGASPAGVGDDDEALFQRLRALRKRLADEQGVPPYVVFSDATLRAMVRARPTDEEGLLQVPGVGRVKLARYGAAFLGELAG